MKSLSEISIGFVVVAVVLPAWAQRGLGIGGVAGGVTGGVGAAASGAVGSAGSGAVNGAASAAGTVTAAPRAQARGIDAAANSATSITSNAELSSRMQTLMPNGVSVGQAAAGFANQGQFVSAVHAAHNLGIPFDQLKARMTTGSKLSLGQAIHAMRPDLDSKDAGENVKLAERQSVRDFTEASAGGKPDRWATRIAADSNLSERLSAMVPQGMTLQQAASGFRNEGEFISTLQASHDRGLSFVDMKDRVTAGQSLGAAIHGMKPSMSAAESESSAAAAQAQAKSIQSRGSAGANARANGSASANGGSGGGANANANANANVSGAVKAK